MKILYLTKYSRNGASSRLRSYQYFPLLNKEGIEVVVKPFFDEEYLNSLYSNKKTSKIKFLKYYFERFFILFSICKYDKIVIEKELFPYFFSWFEKLLFILNINYIVDYDDAIFHNYDLNENKFIRFFLKSKIDNVMKFSSCVLAGNDYLGNKAKESGAKKIIIFPTVIDVDKYKSVNNISTNERLIVGWIGSPSTFKYVKNLNNVFETIATDIPFEIYIIGANESMEFTDSVHYIKWTENTELHLISKIDVGIMPLENTPWELGKCAYKLIQYMGSSKPVVASNIGMNNTLVDNGINGFIVNNEEEWIEKLTILLKNANLRRQFGENGRKKVEEKYSLQHNLNRLIPLLKDGK